MYRWIQLLLNSVPRFHISKSERLCCWHATQPNEGVYRRFSMARCCCCCCCCCRRLVGEQACVFRGRPSSSTAGDPAGQTQSDCEGFDISTFGATERRQEAKKTRKTKAKTPLIHHRLPLCIYLFLDMIYSSLLSSLTFLFCLFPSETLRF